MIIVKITYFYLIVQEGSNYFTLAKGISKLNKTDQKVVKISDDPEEYIFKTGNESYMEEELVRQGFTGNTEAGADYYKVFRKAEKDKEIKLDMRRFSEKYTIISYQELDILKKLE